MDGIYILKTFTSWYSIGLNQMNGSEPSRSDSDSSKLSDLFEDPPENENTKKDKQLWIDRSTCQITESRISLTDEDPVAEIEIDAFIGIVDVLNTYHLGVVTKSEVVAELDLEEVSFNKDELSKILMVKEVKFFPLQSSPEDVYTVGSPNPNDLMGSINYTTLGNLSNLANITNTLNNTLLMSNQEQVQLQLDVQKIIENMEKILSTGYYYSYDTELTNTLQNLYLNKKVPLSDLLKSQESQDSERTLFETDLENINAAGGDGNNTTGYSKDSKEKEEKDEPELMRRNKVLNKLSNKDFNWCYKIGLNIPKRWMAVMIQGYVGYTLSYLNEDRIEVLIVGRRNVKRSGTRFVARGIDEEGNVGNFVESEMRVRLNYGKWYSFVQNRGSVPVFWEQVNFTSPVTLYNYHLNFRSFSKHVDILKEFYNPCYYFLFINLLDVKENEKVLTESFLEVVDEFNGSSNVSSASSDNLDKSRGKERERSRTETEKLREDKNNGFGKDKEKEFCGKIDLINYNYNVNAKWSTHEIIIDYIMNNLNIQLDNVGYFDTEVYLNSVNKYGNKNVYKMKRKDSKKEDLLLVDDLLDFRSKDYSEEELEEYLLGEKEKKRKYIEKGERPEILEKDRRIGPKKAEELPGVKESERVRLTSYRKVDDDNISKDDKQKEEQRERKTRDTGEWEKEDYESLGARPKDQQYKNKQTENEGRDLSDNDKCSSSDGLQKGIIRTNCLDCLDRTNIMQWMLGWVVFNKILNNSNNYGDEEEKDQMLKEMLLGKDGGVKEDDIMFSSFTDLWCNHGDYISIHYSGTVSTLSERVKKTNTSFNSLLHYSKTMVQRYYSSLFQDNQRQTVFNILSPYSSTGSTGSLLYRKQGEDLLLIEQDLQKLREKEDSKKLEKERRKQKREKDKKEKREKKDREKKERRDNKNNEKKETKGRETKENKEYKREKQKQEQQYKNKQTEDEKEDEGKGGVNRKLMSSRYFIQDPFVTESGGREETDLLGIRSSEDEDKEDENDNDSNNSSKSNEDSKSSSGSSASSGSDGSESSDSEEDGEYSEETESEGGEYKSRGKTQEQQYKERGERERKEPVVRSKAKWEGSSKTDRERKPEDAREKGEKEDYESMGARPKEPKDSDNIFDKLNNEIINKLVLLSKSSILPSITTPESSVGNDLISEHGVDRRDRGEEERERDRERKRKEKERRDTGEGEGVESEQRVYREREEEEVYRKEDLGEDLRIWMGSWNIGAHSVEVNDNMLNWMELKKIECDMYIFSFQEFVQLNFINIATGRRDENKEYEFEHLIYNLFKFSTSERYEKLTSISMTGLYLVIFVKKSLRPHISEPLITNVKTGLNYNIGNKGCVGVQFRMYDYELSFLNVHLNFGKNLNVGRIELLEYILKNAFKEYNKNVLDNDLFVFGGDFNFQLQLEKEVVLSMLKRMEFAKLFNYDEFNMAKMIGIPFLNKMYESKIQFQPTYKYKDGTKYYTTKRAPAWCDRIILGGKLFDTRKVKVLSYKRNDNLIVSDHRPISSIILVELKK